MSVSGYGDQQTSEKNYPGVITGQVMGGILNGRSITVALRKTLTNQRVSKVADLRNEDMLTHTPLGGYLALEGVRAENGQITAQWLNRMGAPDTEVRSGMPMQISPVYDKDGNVRRFKDNGATVYNCQILRLSESQTAANLQDFRSQLAAVIEDNGAAMVTLVPDQLENSEPGHLQRKSIMAVRGWRNAERVTVNDAVDQFTARYGKDLLQPYVGAGAKIDITPMEVVRINARVCASIDSGGKTAVPLSRYLTGGLGGRIEVALRRTGKDTSEKMQQAFLAQAHQNAKESFAVAGWKGVWNSDIGRFFESAGIQLPRMPKFGFAVSTGFLGRHFSGEGEPFLNKVRPLTSVLPRDAVPTPSDLDAHGRFHRSIYDATLRMAELLPESPSAKGGITATEAQFGVSNQQQNGVSDDMAFGGSDSKEASKNDATVNELPGGPELYNF